jgi:hypothetical protein
MFHNLIKEMKKTQMMYHNILMFFYYWINNIQFIFSRFHVLNMTLEVNILIINNTPTNINKSYTILLFSFIKYDSWCHAYQSPKSLTISYQMHNTINKLEFTFSFIFSCNTMCIIISLIS